MPGVGTVTNLGTNSVNGSGTSLAITTLANINAGDLVVVFGAGNAGAGGSMSAVTDSGGANVYTFQSQSTTTPTLALAWTFNATSLASGGTITGTFGSSSTRKSICAFSVSAMKTTSGVRDTSVSPSSVTGTSTSATAIATGVLQAQQEILVGAITFSSGGNDPVVAALSGWTNISAASGSSSTFLTLKYKIVSTTASDSTYAPTWTNSNQYRSALRSFIAADAVYTAGGNALLLGVG